MTDKRFKEIEKKMKELYVLISGVNLWGWTKRLEVGDLHKTKGIYMDFHYAEFTEKCPCCNQPKIDEGLIDLYDIQKTNKMNSSSVQEASHE